jgi:hypothetical protein
MPFVRRYRDIETDLDGLFKDIVQELQNVKELNVVKEMNGDVNGLPFKSVTATRSSVPRTLLGTLREVTVTVTGTPSDYIIELHTGEWLNNVILPGAGGIMIAGPLGGVAWAGTTGLLAVEYQRKLKNRIKELVKKNSKKEYTADKVETF